MAGALVGLRRVVALQRICQIGANHGGVCPTTPNRGVNFAAWIEQHATPPQACERCGVGQIKAADPGLMGRSPQAKRLRWMGACGSLPNTAGGLFCAGRVAKHFLFAKIALS